MFRLCGCMFVLLGNRLNGVPNRPIPRHCIALSWPFQHIGTLFSVMTADTSTSIFYDGHFRHDVSLCRSVDALLSSGLFGHLAANTRDSFFRVDGWSPQSLLLENAFPFCLLNRWLNKIKRYDSLQIIGAVIDQVGPSLNAVLLSAS